MERHLATVWESVADEVGEQTAQVQGDVRRTWTEFEDRAARLAGALAGAGLGPGSKVAQYLYNCPEYLETYFAALKVRAIPVNVNYRYLDDELVYLLENSEAAALVYHSSLGDRVGRIRDRLPGLRLLVEVDDGGDHVDGVERYDALATGHERAPRISRSPEDITMIYTGGTTGMPKGVMSAIGPAVDTLMATVPLVAGLDPVAEPSGLAPAARRLADEGRQLVGLPACPLMHGTGLAIGAMPSVTFGGRLALLTARGLDPAEVWSLVEAERAMSLTVVGDAFSRPLVRELREGPARDLSSLQLILSAGAMFSAEVKQGLLDRLPGATIIDYMAASEGAMGVSIASKDAPAVTGRFIPNPGVKVLTGDGREVVPGSGEPGFLAIGGQIPQGYYKDEEKTARTFQVIGGERYSVPGDWATVEADGTITLLGRGSQCINTGGEKVYPEEVEEVIKRHPAVEDCLVFGLPDERFGQRVVGVASLAPGADATPEEVVESFRDQLAAYKLPRRLALVDDVPRAANGKADYATAKQLFAERAAPV